MTEAFLPLSSEDIQRAVAPLLGLPVTLVHFYESVLLIQLGEVQAADSIMPISDATLMITTDWALGSPGGLVVTGELQGSDLEKTLATLHGRTVTKILATNDYFDLVLSLSGACEFVASGKVPHRWHITIRGRKLIPKVKGFNAVDTVALYPFPDGGGLSMNVRGDKDWSASY